MYRSLSIAPSNTLSFTRDTSCTNICLTVVHFYLVEVSTPFWTGCFLQHQWQYRTVHWTCDSNVFRCTVGNDQALRVFLVLTTMYRRVNDCIQPRHLYLISLYCKGLNNWRCTLLKLLTSGDWKDWYNTWKSIYAYVPKDRVLNQWPKLVIRACGGPKFSGQFLCNSFSSGCFCWVRYCRILLLIVTIWHDMVIRQLIYNQLYGRQRPNTFWFKFFCTEVMLKISEAMHDLS